MPKINLGTEPALVVNIATALLALLVTFKFDFLTEENAAAIIAALVAVANLLVGLATRPVAPALFTAVVGAVVQLVGSYGFDISTDKVTAFNGLLLTVLALIFRWQVTPTPHQDDFTRAA